MARLVLMILILIGMGYSVIVGLIEAFKAIVGPAEVIPTKDPPKLCVNLPRGV